MGDSTYNTTASVKAIATINNTIIGQSDTSVSDLANYKLGTGSTAFIGGGTNLIRVIASINQPQFTTTLTSDPLLAALGSNGGPTPTMAPLFNSPVVDAGIDTTLSPYNLTTDQRGLPRKFGAAVDIGAYEGKLALTTDSVSAFTGIINNVAIGSVVGSQTDYVAVGSSGNNFAVALYGPSGTLLASNTTTAFAGQSSAYARAAAVFKKNIFVAGTVIVGGIAEFGVAEYSYAAGPPGTLNLVPTFGSGGMVLIPFSGASAFVTSMAISYTGSIAVVGFTANGGSPPAFAVAELAANGALIPKFGTKGQLTTNFFGQGAQARTAFFSGSELYVAGYAFNPNFNGKMDFALAAFNSVGLDTSSFGGGTGKVTTDFGSSSGGASAQAIAIDSKNRIVLAGYSITQDANGDAVFALARYSSNGVLDTKFGTNGIVTTSFGSGNAAAADGLLIRNGTTLDAVGYFLNQTASTFGYQIAVAQYTYTGTKDGTLDTTNFNNFNRALPGTDSASPGQIATPFVTSSGTPLNGWGQAVVANPTNKSQFFVAGGSTDRSGNYNLALATYDPPPPVASGPPTTSTGPASAAGPVYGPPPAYSVPTTPFARGSGLDTVFIPPGNSAVLGGSSPAASNMSTRSAINPYSLARADAATQALLRAEAVSRAAAAGGFDGSFDFKWDDDVGQDLPRDGFDGIAPPWAQGAWRPVIAPLRLQWPERWLP